MLALHINSKNKEGLLLSKLNTYKWLNAVAIAAVLVMNYLAATLPLFGRGTGEISDMFEILLTPASYAFSIWSVIYLLLVGFVIYQFRNSSESNEGIEAVGMWLVINSLCNIIWLFFWHSLLTEIATVIIILLLLTTIVLYVRTRRIVRPSVAQIILVKLPFSIYMGWVSVATILNIGIVLHKNDWSGFGLSPTVWSVIGLIVGALIALVIGYRYRDSIYPLVFVWAYSAIAFKHQDSHATWLTAIILAVVLFIYAILIFFVRNRTRD